MTKAFVLEWHIPVDKPLLEGDTFDRWSEEEVEEGCRFKVRQKGSLAFFKNSCCHHHSPSSTAHSQLFINCIIIVMVVQGVPKKALSKLPFCETGFEGTWPSTIHCQLSSQLALEGHTLVAGAWTERKKMYHGGSFLKLADDNMYIQNPEAQNRELSGF